MPGETLLIIGAGGLGLMAVQIAKGQKLKEAKKLGTDMTINSLSSDQSRQ